MLGLFLDRLAELTSDLIIEEQGQPQCGLVRQLPLLIDVDYPLRPSQLCWWPLFGVGRLAVGLQVAQSQAVKGQGQRLCQQRWSRLPSPIKLITTAIVLYSIKIATLVSKRVWPGINPEYRRS